MNRRDSVLALLALGTPRVALAQQVRKIPRIGVLSLASFSSRSAGVETLRSSLRDLGYVEGRTIEVELRSAEGRVERLPELAMQLVVRNVDVILTDGGNVSALAARKGTATS